SSAACYSTGACHRSLYARLTITGQHCETGYRLALGATFSISRFKDHHYEPQAPATRPDNQANLATEKNPALGSPSHTCIARTLYRTAALVAPRRIGRKSPEPRPCGRKHHRGSSARSRQRLRPTKATLRCWRAKRLG